MRTVQRAKISTLGYALLGLLYGKPSSGYDLRKIFTTTPLGSFSDSPGAIYPALRRLEEDELIAGEVELGSGMRQRRLYRLTAAGRAGLKAWLRKPLKREQVMGGLSELMLRFSFMDSVLGEERTLEFLRSLQRELSSYVPELRGFFEANKAHMPVSGMLALQNGLFGYEAQLKWAAQAIATYEERIQQ